MQDHRDDYLEYQNEERPPIPRWMAMIYVLVIAGGLALAYMAYQMWLA